MSIGRETIPLSECSSNLGLKIRLATGNVQLAVGVAESVAMFARGWQKSHRRPRTGWFLCTWDDVQKQAAAPSRTGMCAPLTSQPALSVRPRNATSILDVSTRRQAPFPRVSMWIGVFEVGVTQFLVRLRDLLRVAVPGLASPEAFYLALQLALLVARTLLSIRIRCDVVACMIARVRACVRVDV